MQQWGQQEIIEMFKQKTTTNWLRWAHPEPEQIYPKFINTSSSCFA